MLLLAGGVCSEVVEHAVVQFHNNYLCCIVGLGSKISEEEGNNRLTPSSTVVVDALSQQFLEFLEGGLCSDVINLASVQVIITSV